ncbi:MAG: methionyl-tRNA formyltransferase [Deltaproteobacteria bacterium]|nr:methionyl-tRNA formyltransferase [Deltaproteobacteria bacterium]
MRRLRLAFWGTPDIALPCLRAAAAEHEVVLCLTQPDRRAGRGRKLKRQPVAAVADELGIEVYQPAKADQALERLAALKPEAMVVLAYGQLLSPAMLAAAPLGAVNIHFSLLPQLRGAAPINWAILRGHERTGVSSMFMDQGLDTGEVIYQKACPIGAQETAGSLADRLAEMGAQVLLPTLEAIASGNAPRQAQNHQAATWAPMLSKSDGLLDWSQSAVELDRRVRGLDPWPGAYTTLGGKPLKLFAPTKVLESNQGQAPGTVLTCEEAPDMLCVACGQGALALGSVQAAGKRRMEAAQFLRGAGPAAGERLGA